MDFLNILYPVIINLITLGAILIGLFVGLKNGSKYQFLKLFLLAGAVVGLYFLTPIVHGLIAIDARLLFSAMILIAYIIIEVVLSIIRVHSDKMKVLEFKTQRLLNSAKPLKGIKNRRKLSAEIKEALKRPTASKGFGALFGIIIAVALIFTVYIPVRPIIIDFAEAHNITTVEYTLVEQIDKLGVEDLLNNLQGE